MDTNNWNPVHFATFYKQKKVLEYFQLVFPELDIRFAMRYSLTELDCYEGSVYRKKDQQRSLQQKIVQGLLEDNYHLYGFFLAILTQTVDMFQFICSAEGPCLPDLRNILVLIQIC